MSVVDLIHERDRAVRLIWEQRCDCKTRPLIAAVYLHEGTRHLYLPAIKGPHVSQALRVRQRAKTWPLGDAFGRVSQCSRCRTFFLLSSAPVPTGVVLVMTFHGYDDLPDDRPGPDQDPRRGRPFQAGDRTVNLEVRAEDTPLTVMPGLVLTRLRPATHAVTAP